jgi:translation elongation factor EF-Tu-like GTPase
MDTRIPDPRRDVTSQFLMPVENVLTADGRSTVVIGRVERGVVTVGATVKIVGLVGADAKPRTAVVTGIQAFYKDLEQARPARMSAWRRASRQVSRASIGSSPARGCRAPRRGASLRVGFRRLPSPHGSAPRSFPG